MPDISEEELRRIEHRREVDRARKKRYYDKHRDELLEKGRERRLKARESIIVRKQDLIDIIKYLKLSQDDMILILELLENFAQ